MGGKEERRRREGEKREGEKREGDERGGREGPATVTAERKDDE